MRRVTLCRDGLPDRSVWLVMKRSLGEAPSYWYYISNAPLSTRLPLFVWLSGVRWAIEQCFEESKTELGTDHYEMRKYPGWHHHMLTCILAYFFLWHLQIRVVLENRNKPYAAFSLSFACPLLTFVGGRFAGGLPSRCPWSAGIRRRSICLSICHVQTASFCTGHQIYSR